MPLFNTKAIVIKAVNYSEADKIVTFFTQDYGKIQGIAKSARRTKSKFGASLEPLTLSKIIYFGKENTNIFKINSADIIDPFNTSRDNYERLTRSLYIADTVNTFTEEHNPQPKLFRLLYNSLKTMGDISGIDKIETRVNIFQLKFLTHIGYGINLHGCVICRKPLVKLAGFNLNKGGVVCSQCMVNSSSSIYVSQGIINFMKSVTISDSNFLDRLIINSKLNTEIQTIIKKYFLVHTRKEVRAANFV